MDDESEQEEDDEEVFDAVDGSDGVGIAEVGGGAAIVTFNNRLTMSCVVP